MDSFLSRGSGFFESCSSNGIEKACVFFAEDKESRRGAGLRTDVMERYEEEGEDSDNETDPEQLLNEWLGELDSLTVVSSFFNIA